MTTSTDWQPGDPLIEDHGCGGFVTPTMTPDERAAAIAADHGLPPPWWRPNPETTIDTSYYTRSCTPCGVQWRGDEPCWACGGEQLP